MYLVFLGVLLLAAKMAEVGPTATWSWWIVLSPFLAAIVWWHFADTSGLTKRREMVRMEERKKHRREKAMQALGLDAARDRRAAEMRDRLAAHKAASSAGAATLGAAAVQPVEPIGRPTRSADPTQ